MPESEQCGGRGGGGVLEAAVAVVAWWTYGSMTSTRAQRHWKVGGGLVGSPWRQMDAKEKTGKYD